jgi:hypothetical protein
MTTKHYVTPEGVYIGGFGDGAEPPSGAIEVKTHPTHAKQLWVDNGWQAYLPSKAEQETNRHAAFTTEADPLFFKWQAGEATEEDWLAKRQEIRDRYPYPSE